MNMTILLISHSLILIAAIGIAADSIDAKTDLKAYGQFGFGIGLVLLTIASGCIAAISEWPLKLSGETAWWTLFSSFLTSGVLMAVFGILAKPQSLFAKRMAELGLLFVGCGLLVAIYVSTGVIETEETFQTTVQGESK